MKLVNFVPGGRFPILQGWPGSNIGGVAETHEIVLEDCRQRFNAECPSHFGALCVRERADKNGLEVLLTTSRDSGRWVIPKGRPIRGHKPHQVARREAWEEAGVRGLVHKPPCGHFHYLKTLPRGGLAHCLVQVHVLDVARLMSAFPEMAERRLQWFCPQEAAAAVNEPELSAMLLVVTIQPGIAGNR